MNDEVFTGIVLTSMPVGEYDKRISLLTLERGKISVFLRGAKRPNSHLLAASTPFSFGSFHIYEGRSSFTAKKANIQNHFDILKKDLTLTCYASYFCEVAEYYAREGNDEKERLTLLFQSLRALESNKFSPEFIKLIYDLKTLHISGEYPNVFTCMKCGSKENLKYFSLEKRGCICEKCVDKNADITMSESALYTFMFIFKTPAKSLFSFKISDAVEDEMSRIYQMYRRRYFPHPFKSEDFLSL